MLSPQVSRELKSNKLPGAMSVLLSLLSLLVTAGGGWHHGVVAVSMEQTTVSYYCTPSEVMAYWQTMLPNSPVPLAILEHLSTSAGSEKTTLQWGTHGTRSDGDKVTNQKGCHLKTTLESEEPTKEDDDKISIRWEPHSDKIGRKITLGEKTHTKKDDVKISTGWGPHLKEVDQKTTLGWGGHTKEDGGDTISLEWGAHSKDEDDHKASLGWGVRIKEDDDKISMEWGAHLNDDHRASLGWGTRIKEDNDKISMQWGEHSNDDHRALLGRGTHIKEDNDKISMEWGEHKTDDHRASLGLGARIKEDDDKISMEWGTHLKDDDNKASLGWGPHIKEDDDKISTEWGAHSNDDHRASLGWGAHIKKDDDKISMEWGAHSKDHSASLGRGARIKEDEDKISMEWGTHLKNDDPKTTLGWGTHIKEDDDAITVEWDQQYKNDDIKTKLRKRAYMTTDEVKISTIWGPHSKEDDKKTTLRGSHMNRDDKEASRRKNPRSHKEGGHHHHHVNGADHKHGHINMANFLFSEDVLIPGATLTPYIESSASPAPFLHRDIADAIPLSTKNFTDVLSMFAPVSLAMERKIWSTLHTCEHPHPLEGEQQACATSMESMVELAASVLGTRNLHAFSSSADVPAEGLASPTSMYTVAAVHEVTVPTGMPAVTMTCHGMAFPYAVFYFHAVNPTRVYSVTLSWSGAEQEDGGQTPMEALVVCHLDTSRFDPGNPFFVARGLKPGDAAVCHLLSRDSVLWAPAASSTAAQGNVSAQ